MDRKSFRTMEDADRADRARRAKANAAAMLLLEAIQEARAVCRVYPGTNIAKAAVELMATAAKPEHDLYKEVGDVHSTLRTLTHDIGDQHDCLSDVATDYRYGHEPHKKFVERLPAPAVAWAQKRAGVPAGGDVPLVIDCNRPACCQHEGNGFDDIDTTGVE